MISQDLLKNYEVKWDEPLSNYTYTKVGGNADALVFPRSVEEAVKLVKLAKETACPLTVLGNASNLIVRDGGIRGMVMLFEKLTQITLPAESTRITVEAGATLKDLTIFAQQEGLSGLEFACGIPGSVGGAVFMNAGAYGGEVADVIASVCALDPVTGEIKDFQRANLTFGYRQSLIREQNLIVLSASFDLKAGNKDEIQARMTELNELRASKQPLEYPSCGSVFKRPEGHFAGQLIQEAGCQGHRIGGVEVSTKHAGFMVNVNHGAAKDYEDLIHWVIERVQKNSGITLEPEVRIIGEALTN